MRITCKNSGYDIDDHFAHVGKMVEAGGNATALDVIITISGVPSVAQFAALVQAVGAANVHIARNYTINDVTSNQLIGSGPTGVWTDPCVDGTGMYVGVVDTGVDYHHPDLGDMPTSTFSADKIVAGHDF